MKTSLIKPCDALTIHHIPADTPDAPVFVWAHGWKRSHQDFLPIAQQLTSMGEHFILDLPGHDPNHYIDQNWNQAEYIAIIENWLNTLKKPIHWIGHSVGCRIGIRLNAEKPKLLQSLFLVCPPANLNQKSLRVKINIYLYKILKRMGVPQKRLSDYFGSHDYRNAGKLKKIFISFVNEDSMVLAKQTSVKTFLVFAENDTAIPEANQQALIEAFPKEHVKSTCLKYFDHLSILTDGQHQLIQHLLSFHN